MSSNDNLVLQWSLSAFYPFQKANQLDSKYFVPKTGLQFSPITGDYIEIEPTVYTKTCILRYFC